MQGLSRHHATDAGERGAGSTAGWTAIRQLLPFHKPATLEQRQLVLAIFGRASSLAEWAAISCTCMMRHPLWPATRHHISAVCFFVLQSWVKKLPINKTREWLDACRQLAPMQKVTDQVNQLCPYDPAAALWVLRVTCYRHGIALRPDPAAAQKAISDQAAQLKKSCGQLANRLMFDADAYQVRRLRCRTAKWDVFT